MVTHGYPSTVFSTAERSRVEDDEVTGFRASDRFAPLLATGAAVVMIAGVVAGKAARDGLFMSAYPASALPKVVLASALSSLVAVVLASRMMARFGPAKLVPALFAVSGAAHVAEWLLLGRFAGTVTVLLYVHVSTMTALLVSGFWSVATERFDPRTAKKVFGTIGTGATVGGLVGGLVAERVASWFGAPALLVTLAAMNVSCGLAVYGLGGAIRRAPGAERATQEHALADVKKSPLLASLAALVLCTAIAAGALDYVFKAQASMVIPDREKLVSFFAVFYTATSLFTVVMQSALGRRALARLGIGGTLALLPGAVLVTGVLGAAVLRLWSVVLLRGAELVLRNSLFRSGYELLYTPVPVETKRATKTLIDVGGDRVGDAAASGLVLAALWLAPSVSSVVVVAIGLASAVAALWVSLRVHAAYVGALADSLKSGELELEAAEVVDATTMRTLAETNRAIDRQTLLRQIEQLRTSRDGGEAREDSGIAAQAADLLAEDPSRAAKALERSVDPRLAGLVIPLLGVPGVAGAARASLMRIASRIVGQLVDALLDPQQPDVVARRLPGILAEVDDARAVTGLVAGLADKRSRVRERCAIALQMVSARRPELAPPRDEILSHLEREVGAAKPDLSYVFRLLSLTHEAESMHMAQRALGSEEPSLRGTALEYLENVLHPRTHAALLPHLERVAEGAARVPERPRSREVLLADLRKSIRFDKAELAALSEKDD